MTTETSPSPASATGGPDPTWRTIELMTTAVIGVVFGIAYWGWSSGYTAIDAAAPALGAAKGLLGGPWLIAGVVAGFVVRRPGAALIAETLAAAVSGIIGTQWGASVLLAGVLQGLGVELALALFLFRSYRVWVAALGGVLAAVFETLYEWDAYWAEMTTTWKFGYLACFAFSGAVVAGVGGWLLVRALAASGAIDALPAGREAAERDAA